MTRSLRHLSGKRYPTIAVYTLTIAGLLAVAARHAAAENSAMVKYNSRYYTIHSNLSKEEVREYGRHMDAVFKQYSKRFRSFSTRDGRSMPLYLFRARDHYLSFLKRHNIDGSGSGGMFFIRRGAQGLVTYTEGRTRSMTFEVLQHEGFHQFAYAYIGPELPLWVNEGLAEYFADGILVRDRMKLGLANDRRTLSVQSAIRQYRAIGFDDLLEMSSKQWNRNMIDNPQLGSLQYDQSWSIVHFLIHGDGGKYRAAFEKYLMLVNKGRPSGSAFRMAFGTQDTDAFHKRWRDYVMSLKPDPLTTAIANMAFIAQGLKTLHEHEIPLPSTLQGLRQTLQKVKFRSIRSHHGVSIEVDAEDDSLYTYQNRSGATVPFQLLEAEANYLLPRIIAPGLKPEPMVVWQLDEDELVPDITYR